MNTAAKVFLVVFVVAAITLCTDAQSNRIGGGRPGGRYGYGGRGSANQANQGGDTSQGNGQSAFNTNFGSGDVNNDQSNKGSQQGNQQNRNGGRGYY